VPGPFLGGLQTALPVLQHAHVLAHQLVDRLQLLLHPLHVLHRARVFELFFLGLDDAVEPDEIVIAANGLEAGLVVGSPKEAFGLVEERCDDGVDEAVCQFDRVALIDDHREDHVVVDLVVYSVSGVIDLLEWALLSFGVGGDLGVVLLDFVANRAKLLVGVDVTRLAQDQTVT
jgi:hypothetical protein